MNISFPSFPSRFSRAGAGFAVAALAVASLLVPAAQGADTGDTYAANNCIAWDRLGGANAIETSDLVANRAYPTGSSDFLVASARNPVDALPGGALGVGPILLTDGKSWNLETLAKYQNVTILGGYGAVEELAETFFDEHGISSSRLQGPDRNATASAIADRWVKVHGQPTHVYVTRNTGAGSPDAVAASVVRDGPILTFTSAASLQAAAAKIQAMHPNQGVVILGGEAVVSAAEANILAGGLQLNRLSGMNRYETSRVIASWVAQTRPVHHIYLASGHALKDAMVAGAFNDGVILLTPPDGSGINEWARMMNADGITVVGGLGVVSDAAAQIAACGETAGITNSLVQGLLYPLGTDQACTTASWNAAESRGLMEQMPNTENACWQKPTGTHISIQHRGDYFSDGYPDAIVYVSDVDGTMVFLVVYNPANPSQPYVSYLWGGNGDWGFRVVEESSYPLFELLSDGQVVKQLSVADNIGGKPEVALPVS